MQMPYEKHSKHKCAMNSTANTNVLCTAHQTQMYYAHRNAQMRLHSTPDADVLCTVHQTQMRYAQLATHKMRYAQDTRQS